MLEGECPLAGGLAATSLLTGELARLVGECPLTGGLARDWGAGCA